MEIAKKEGFSYTPFILNQDYIRNSFLDSALKTIQYSNGMRSYRRSHYIYAMQQLELDSGIFISGNFGDEMFKFAKFFPSEVISKEFISLAESGFRKRRNLFMVEILRSRVFQQIMELRTNCTHDWIFWNRKFPGTPH